MVMIFQNPAFIFIFVITLWITISFAISLIGGWFALSRVYRATLPFDGQRWRFQDAQLRLLTGYHNIVSVGANAEGLHLSVFLLFRFAHAPLFIPWQDISVKPGRVLWVRIYQFEFRQVPAVRLCLKETLGQKLQVAAGAAWPGDRTATGVAF